MDIYDVIYERRSVREYLDKDVPDELIEKIIGAARLAPSARNFQEWRFVVVKDAQTREKLSQAAKGQKFVAEAPVVIACCAETNNHVMSCYQPCYPIDVAIAIDHLTLCAASEGLGTCWVGAFFENEVKEILEIPPHIRVVELLPMGWPKDVEPKEKVRLPMDVILKRERW